MKLIVRTFLALWLAVWTATIAFSESELGVTLPTGERSPGTRPVSPVPGCSGV